MRSVLFFVAAFGLAACDTPVSPVAATVSSDAVLSAKSSSEVLALGARQLSGGDIRSELVDKTLANGVGSGWTWNIKSDGTSSSRADNGAWETSSTWDIAGDQYCRQNETMARKCSNVYELGGIYRFTEEGNALANWAVTVK